MEQPGEPGDQGDLRPGVRLVYNISLTVNHLEIACNAIYCMTYAERAVRLAPSQEASVEWLEHIQVA